MLKWGQKIIDILLPPRCLVCGKVLEGENGLCEDCFKHINFISAPICYKCGNPLPAGQKGICCPVCVSDKKNPFRFQRSRVYYDEASRPLVTNFKFHDRTENAAFLGRWLHAAGHDIWQEGVDAIVPVPLHRARLRQRKYNQSALLCTEVSKITGIPVEYNTLIRHKNTLPQVSCSGSARIRNVKNAFSLNDPEKFKNKRVVIIDDVMTTGSTLRECATVLLKGGAQSVDALTVARVIKG